MSEEYDKAGTFVIVVGFLVGVLVHLSASLNNTDFTLRIHIFE